MILPALVGLDSMLVLGSLGLEVLVCGALDLGTDPLPESSPDRPKSSPLESQPHK